MPEKGTVKLNLPMKGALGSYLVSNKVGVHVNKTLNEACVIIVIDISEENMSRPPVANATKAE